MACIKGIIKRARKDLIRDIPDPLASTWWEASLHVLLALPEPTQSTDFASLLHGGGENMTSCSAGSLKQLLPVSSNF